ncbi:MAG: CDP-alcohol phosphatidyltransferase family protein [Deltaproteobacteria bacterium]|nr:CDP-alcohol phosphatidyltransferase family protein [Deltaproteobacteria bacterium]
MKNIPNILSLLRIVLAPVLLYLAWFGQTNPFIIVLVISLLSDVFDGFFARKLHATSEAGARLDSIGDLATYTILPACVWWLWPEIIKREALYVIIAVSAYFLPLIAGIIKFHQIPSYHTYGAKAAAILMCTAMILMFTTEFSTLFRIAAIFQAVVAVEEIAITIHLSALKSNVKSIWHVSAEPRQT